MAYPDMPKYKEGECEKFVSLNCDQDCIKVKAKCQSNRIGYLTCSPKTDPVVKLVLRNIIGLRKGKTHATKEIQA